MNDGPIGAPDRGGVQDTYNGFLPYDHTAVSRLPEYATALHALDELSRAMERGGMDCTLARWADTARNMALSLFHKDTCPRCFEAGHNPEPSNHHRVEASGKGGVMVHYRCDRGHEWATGMAAAMPLFGV